MADLGVQPWQADSGEQEYNYGYGGWSLHLVPVRCKISKKIIIEGASVHDCKAFYYFYGKEGAMRGYGNITKRWKTTNNGGIEKKRGQYEIRGIITNKRGQYEIRGHYEDLGT
ncbi:MAG: hypothetical protein K9G38_04370 [Bacteroidales bacterium]|nr:hypothetical protein [Bacteroidales bacterium]